MLLQIGIPMFFYISGFSITFFNTEKKTFKQYFCDKFQRLIIPLVVGVLFILVPRLYLIQDFDDFSWINQDGPEYNFLIFYAKIIAGKFILKISWLWFLLALFCDSIIAYPLLCWTQRRSKGIQVTLKEDG